MIVCLIVGAFRFDAPSFWAKAGVQSAVARTIERRFFIDSCFLGGREGCRGAKTLRSFAVARRYRVGVFLAGAQEQLARDEQVEAVADVAVPAAVPVDGSRDAAAAQVRALLRASIGQQVEPWKIAAEPAIERQREAVLAQA